jgi:hypothetical protein
VRRLPAGTAPIATMASDLRRDALTATSRREGHARRCRSVDRAASFILHFIMAGAQCTRDSFHSASHERRSDWHRHRGKICSAIATEGHCVRARASPAVN